MRIKKYFKNSIASFIIASFLLMPFLSVAQVAEAQSSGISGNLGGIEKYLGLGSGGGSGGMQGYLSGLAPAIAKLPGCMNLIKLGARKLFSGTKSLVETVGVSTLSAMSVDTTDMTLHKKVDSLDNKTEESKEHNKSVNVAKTCTDAIGKMVIKMLLQKITLSTVAWIQGGFEGKPAFVQDPGRFFGDIAKNEILQFGLEIGNPALFPFGKAFMQNQVLAFNNKFQQNAQYSLNQMIANTTPQFSTETFQKDFSQGGWNAWSSMTQVPANNPIGFQIMASNEIQRRLEGTIQSRAQNVRDGLKTAGGYLGDERCVDPWGLKREDHNKALVDNPYSNMPSDDPARLSWEEDNLCREWKYVTPGHMVAASATKLVNYPDNNLLEADDLNDAIASILDALLAKFSGDLMTKGFANMSTQGADGTPQFNSTYINKINQPSQAETDFPPHLRNSSTWLANNPDFNIRTDMTQALIDEQRIYITKLQEQNKELMSKTPAGKNYGLLPIIYQLDYCIPGPHPGWENDAQITLDDIKSKIKNLTGLDFVQITQATGRPIPGTNISGSTVQVLSLLADILLPGTGGPGKSDVNPGNIDMAKKIAGGVTLTEETARDYYKYILDGILGLATKPDGQIGTYEQVIDALDKIFSGYTRIINNIFDPLLMPSVTGEAVNEFNTIAGYRQMIVNNTKSILLNKSVVIKLVEIKTEIENLNNQRDSGTITPEIYENNLNPWISAFGRLSLNMVTGDDIAKADSILQQIKDKKVYIYNNLLKGPTGCEKEVSQMKWQMSRYTYPFPILYDYNIYSGATYTGATTGTSLPDPLPHLHASNVIFNNASVFRGNFTLQGGLGTPSSTGLFWAAYIGSNWTYNQDGYSFCQYIGAQLGLDQSLCTSVSIGAPTFIYAPVNGTQGGQVVPAFEASLKIY